MDQERPHLERQNQPLGMKLPPKRKFPKIFWTIVIVVLVFLGVIFAKAYNFSSKVFVNRGSVFGKLFGLIFPGHLTGEASGRINILLLGYGGEGHDGPYLTDSMILASVNPDQKQVLLTSIPRDYYWPGKSGNKINAVYSDAFVASNYKDPLAAGQAAEAAVSKLTGLEVPYFAAIDFSGFKKAVDRVGGLDVNVERTFTDAQYPNDNFGYLPPITFYKGQQHMDGTRALEFARSRHADGPEGSDFARSRRQEIILQAFKQKVQSLGLLSNSSTLNDLINIAADHFSTNLDPSDILHLANMLRGNDYTFISQSFDPSNGLVCNNILDNGEFVIKPCGGVSDSQIQAYFANGFQNQQIKNEGAKVLLENSGSDDALYNAVKTELQQAGINFYEVPYQGIPLSGSVLYEIHSKPLTENFIEEKLDIKSQKPPKGINISNDLILIVGGS